MLKKLLKCFVLVLLSNSFHSLAQHQSLVKLNDSSIPDTIRLQNAASELWSLSLNAPDSSILFCNQALEIAKSIKSKTIASRYQASIYNTIANAYAIKSDFPEALNYNFKSAKIKEELGDKARLANSYNNIANIYSYLTEDRKALSYYFKALQLYQESKKTPDFAATFLNIGVVYIGMHNGDSALYYENKAFDSYKLTNDSAGMGNALRYVGNSYVEKKNYTAAMSSYKKAIQFVWPQGLDIQRASIYLNIANVSNKLQQHQLALNYIDTAGKVIVEVGDTYLESFIHQVKAEAYSAMGDYKKAYSEFVLFKDLSDTLFTSQNQMEMLRKQIDFDNDVREIKIRSKEQELLIQKQKNELAAVVLQKTKRLRVFILASVIFIAILLIVIMQFLNLKKRKQQQDFYTGKLLESQEEERKRIAFELHDSLGQNLVAIKGSLENKNKTLEKSELADNIKHAIEEVRSISKNLYPGELEQLGFNNAIQALLNRIESEQLFVSNDLAEVENKLNETQKINCYRIIQESVSNTLKHAEATSLRVTSELHSSSVTFVIQDNGVGFNITSQKGLQSTGMISIKQRVEILKGKLDIQSENKKGTRISFSIPLF